MTAWCIAQYVLWCLHFSFIKNNILWKHISVLYGLCGFLEADKRVSRRTGTVYTVAYYIHWPGLVIALVLAVLATVASVRIYRKGSALRPSGRFCDVCGYDLRGGADARCPECGYSGKPPEAAH